MISFPYVSRVLHVENIGIYNFCQSVISYFSLAAGLDISTYAIREGARYRDNKEKMSAFAFMAYLSLGNFVSFHIAGIKGYDASFELIFDCTWRAVKLSSNDTI